MNWGNEINSSSNTLAAAASCRSPLLSIYQCKHCGQEIREIDGFIIEPFDVPLERMGLPSGLITRTDGCPGPGHSHLKRRILACESCGGLLMREYLQYVTNFHRDGSKRYDCPKRQASEDLKVAWAQTLPVLKRPSIEDANAWLRGEPLGREHLSTWIWIWQTLAHEMVPRLHRVGQEVLPVFLDVSEKLLERLPQNPTHNFMNEEYLLRVEILRNFGRFEEASAELERIMATGSPKTLMMWIQRYLIAQQTTQIVDFRGWEVELVDEKNAVVTPGTGGSIGKIDWPILVT